MSTGITAFVSVGPLIAALECDWALLAAEYNLQQNAWQNSVAQEKWRDERTKKAVYA